MPTTTLDGLRLLLETPDFLSLKLSYSIIGGSVNIQVFPDGTGGWKLNYALDAPSEISSDTVPYTSIASMDSFLKLLRGLVNLLQQLQSTKR